MQPLSKFLTFILGIASGILFANTFADAAGLPDPRFVERYAETEAIVYRVLCGIVVSVLTMAFLPFVLLQTRAGLTALSGITQRPSQPIAITLIVCGTVCLLGTLIFEWNVAASGAIVKAVNTVTINNAARGEIALRVQTPVMGHVAALAALIVGVGLIGLGIWSSIPAAGHITTLNAEPAGRSSYQEQGQFTAKLG